MKKNYLRTIGTLGLAALTAAGLLAGCGSSSSGSGTAAAEQTTAAASAESSADTPEAGGDAVYRTLDEIRESGTINIGVFSDKNPFGYVDENGTYQGYDVYFAERIGKDLGVEINYVSTEAASRVEYLETGKVDVVLANFTVTEERAKAVDFALPYMNVALGVVSHED
ncbi:MAG: transporter substrate-binding domain-containing protein, partial [Clostridium sp.]|nr:transporter substrate-binding domain-containing protein [Clostridium sp.]